MGEFVVQNLRDRVLRNLDQLLIRASKAPGLQPLQKSISNLDPAQIQVLRATGEGVIRAGMHDFLFALQKEADANGSIRLFVDGEESAKLSDGLEGEILGVEGWIAGCSKFSARIEIERSKRAEDWIRQTFMNNDGNKA